MGKRIDRIKNWIDAKLMSVTELSDMEKVAVALSSLEQKRKEIDEAYYSALGERDFTNAEVDKAKKVINDIVEAARTCSANGDEDNLKLLFTHKGAIEKTLVLHQETLAVQNKVIDQMFKIKVATKAKYEEVNQLKSQLELKDNYTATVEKYKSFVGTDADTVSIDEALKGIDVKYSAANYQMEDLSREASIDDIIANNTKDADFQTWKDSL